MINESLRRNDLRDLVKKVFEIDSYKSKIGDDNDVVVLSFTVTNEDPARDLENFVEMGYDFVLDADRSPGEIKPNRYLVYVELRRRSTAGSHVETLIDDLGTLTEFEPKDWTMHYRGEELPFSRDAFDATVPLSPREYRERYEKDLNEMRVAAGMPVVTTYDKKDRALQSIQSAAGII